MRSRQLPSCAWPHEAEIRARLCECLQLCSVAGLNQAKLCLLGSGCSKTLSVRVCFRGLYPSESGSGAYYGNIPNVRPHYVGLRSSKPGLSLSSHFLCWVNSHPKGLAWLGPFRSLKYCLLLSTAAIYRFTPSFHFFNRFFYSGKNWGFTWHFELALTVGTHPVWWQSFLPSELMNNKNWLIWQRRHTWLNFSQFCCGIQQGTVWKNCIQK